MKGRGPVRRLFRLGLGRPNQQKAAAWEVAHHLDEVSDRLVAEGWDPEEAKSEARRRFGDPAAYIESRSGTEHGRRMMGVLSGIGGAAWWSLKSFGRTVWRSPGYAAAIIVTLGLGIGANGAMFQILDRLLLRPGHHIVEPDDVRRLLLSRTFLGRVNVSPSLTYPDLNDLRTVPEFASVGGFNYGTEAIVGRGDQAAPAWRVLASHDFFTTLGVRPFRGRFFGPEDDRVGSELTVVVGHEYWAQALGSDPDVVGKSLVVDGSPHTVIGVAPEGFTGVDLRRVDLWLPLEAARAHESGDDTFVTHRGYWFLSSVVRMRDGALEQPAMERASALHVAARSERVAEGRYDGDAEMLATSLTSRVGSRNGSRSLVALWLTGVSLVVLLIACANVANLLLARGEVRRREVAVRLAMGISRVRLIGERIAESVLLGLAGGLVALALARLAGVLRSALIPDVLWTADGMLTRLLPVVLGLSVVVGLLAGLGPAVQSLGTDLTRDLRSGGRGQSRRRTAVRGSLVVAQTALSTVLLVGAGLFLKSAAQVETHDLGIDAHHVAQIQLELEAGAGGGALDVASDGAATHAESLRGEAYRAALERVLAHPRVSVAALSGVAFGDAYGEGITVPGIDSLPRLPGGGPYYYWVGPGYFETMGSEVLRGRVLNETDRDGEAVAVISETMWRSLWPDEDPVGKCFMRGTGDACTTVVGVVANASRGSLDESPHMAYYLPMGDGTAPEVLYARIQGDTEAGMRELRGLLRESVPGLLYARVASLREILDPQTQVWSLGSTMFTLFGGLALLVAVLGLYSLLAFDVAARVQELGIRSALGAPKGRLLGSVLVWGARLGLLGLALGLTGAAIAGPFVEDLLFHVKGRDVGVFLFVALCLGLASVGAALVPAYRATRVDPAVALAAE